jgi:hypothetical protein
VASILIVIYHSMPEFDVVLPIVTQLKSENRDLDIEIAITNEKLYERLRRTPLYMHAIEKNGIEITTIFRKDLIDRSIARKSIFLRTITRIHSFLCEPYHFIRFFGSMVRADIYMHEFTKQMYQVYMLYLMAFWSGKRIYTYNHAGSLNLNTRAKRVSRWGKSVALSFDERTEGTFHAMGYDTVKTIGHPWFFPAWKSLIVDYAEESGTGRGHIVIYSRNIHPDCMDADIYENLHMEAYRTIGELFGEIRIVVKPHPKEDMTNLEHIIERSGMARYIEISNEHPMVLAIGATVAISLYTSAILSAIAMGTPAVEYYRESSGFREREPMGSAYAGIGIRSCSEEEELKSFLISLKKGEYESPQIYERFSGKYDLSPLLIDDASKKESS